MRMNRGHDYYNEKKLLIIEQILLVRTLGNTQRKEWRICIYIDVRV